MMMGNGGFPPGLSLASVSGLYKPDSEAGGVVSLQQTISPSGEQLVIKRKRGRPPKNYFQPRPTYSDGRPKENYNATNLPFGDFSYLTDMMYAGGMAGYAFPSVTAVDPERDVDMDAHASGKQPDRHVDQPNRSFDQPNRSYDQPNRSYDQPNRSFDQPITIERPDRTVDLSSPSDDNTEDSRTAEIEEIQVTTVGDCQIIKLPPEKTEVEQNGQVMEVDDCTIRPVEAESQD